MAKIHKIIIGTPGMFLDPIFQGIIIGTMSGFMMSNFLSFLIMMLILVLIENIYFLVFSRNQFIEFKLLREIQERKLGVKTNIPDSFAWIFFRNIKIIFIAFIVGYAIIFTKNIIGLNDNKNHFNKSVEYSNKAAVIINQGKAFSVLGRQESGEICHLREKELGELNFVKIKKESKNCRDIEFYIENRRIKGLQLYIDGYRNDNSIHYVAGQEFLLESESWLIKNKKNIASCL